MLRRAKLFVGCIVLLLTMLTIIDITQFHNNDKGVGIKPVVEKVFESGLPATKPRIKAQSINVNKWIVITTVAYPTEAIKALSAEEEWRIVIVADKKTPADWTLKNCDFLSIEKQEKLGYAINNYVPYKSYTRKMIGYLYAIANGAEWIYDTDDDNQPIEKGLGQFDLKTGCVSGISYGEEALQDENFFGQPGMWPRGYPLDNLNQENNNSSYFLCKKQKIPAIQQGLVRKDPDVDAIYRLLYADKDKGLEINFNPHAPPVILNKGVYCPFNSQNTLFHRDAFWALLLPTSVAFRVTDIWRSYFAQKLLHLTGNRMGFYPPNALQNRNIHSFLRDFDEEILFYTNAGRMVDFLTNWTCSSTVLANCMTELSEAFVRERFWNSTDLDLTTAWIADLNSLDYKFPAMVNAKLGDKSDESESCRKASLNFLAKNEKRNEQARRGYNELKYWCGMTNSSLNDYCFDETKNFADGTCGRLQKTALVITSNYAFGPSVSLLQRFYETHFAAVIFCGPVYMDRIHSKNATDNFLEVLPFNYINVSASEIYSGYRAYVCPTKAIELRLQNINGYMVIADDAVYNFWNEFDTSRFRLAAMTKAKYGIWWNHPGGVGARAMNQSISLIKNRTETSPDSALSKELAEYSKLKKEDIFVVLHELLWSIGDFYFVPRSCESLFYEMSEVFLETNLFHEIAVPSLAALCGMDWRKLLATDAKNATHSDIEPKKYKHLWGEPWKEKYSNELIYLHPIKLSTVYETEEKKNYCNGPINFFLKALSRSNIIAAVAPSISTTTPTSTSTTIAITEVAAAALNKTAIAADSVVQVTTTAYSKNISFYNAVSFAATLAPPK